MKESNTKNFDLREFLLRTLTDPVLWYTALIMSALMYHYRDRVKTDNQGLIFAIGWGIATFAIGWVMFRIFDYMQKHHILGFGIYAVILAAFGTGVRLSLDKGVENYPITWMLWFLTPQDSLEYNYWYTLGFFLLFMLFMGSVIYYFTRVRYRIFMNFLIFIIPFAIYGKEYEKMPTGFIILLTVGYVMLMVYYRQLADSETAVFVGKRQSWKAVVAYAVAFSSIAAIIPKPTVNEDRSYLETLINADAFTDKLNSMLDVFRDTTTGDQFRSRSRNFYVFEAKAQEPLRIKMQTLSTYNFAEDQWSTSDLDDYYNYTVDSAPLDIGSRMGVADAILKAASLDSDYAEKYGLTKFVEEGLDEPEVRQAKFYSMYGFVGMSKGSHMAPVPENAIALTDCTRKGNMARLHGGVVYAIDSMFSTTEKFTFDYSADTFFMSRRNNEFIEAISKCDYSELLNDTKWILDDERDKGFENDEDKRAYEYFNVDYLFYDDYLSYYLDYDKNRRIKELSDEITAGCETEYEKACALEVYFYDNDFIYDLTYNKKKGENAENFLFDTKRGVCYEYATAMVLLARAAGIPARYCEGYNMSKPRDESVNSGANYIITTEDMHGFPELYIKGYGWLSFEPTVTDNVVENKQSTATDKLAKMGIYILIFGLLAVLLSFAYPFLSHKFFLIRAKNRSANDTVKAIMRRICKIYDIESVNTSCEVGSLVHERSGAYIEGIIELFDRAVYGEETLSDEEKEGAIAEYVRAFEALRESKKRKNKIDLNT